MVIELVWQKNSRKIIPILALAILVLAGHFVFNKNNFQTTLEKPATQTAKTPPAENSLKIKPEVSQSGRLKEQIGQMLILGFRGTQYQKKSFIGKAINELKIGGVVLFDYDVPSGIFPRNITNPDQVKKLTADLQKNSATPLFIAIDVEGGLVNRLKPKYGFMEIPSAFEMGQGSPENTFKIAAKLGEQLKNLGINFGFAPVVNLNLLDRSFGSEPQIVTTYAENFINGLAENKIISSIKYFPGYSPSQNNLQQEITDITSTYQAKELVPFQELIKKNIVPAIIIAHTFNKNLDTEYPATLSKNTIQKTLKELLNFKGVVVCDDLSAGEILKKYSPEQAAVKMVKAGCDLTIISNNIGSYDESLPQKIAEAILKSISEGEIATSSIEASYNKIINLKKEFAIIK